MIKNLAYYYRLISYKLSLEGEDNDDAYNGHSVYHNGKNVSQFSMDGIVEGYPTITNVKLSKKQMKLKERELEKLQKLKEKAQTERDEYKVGKQKTIWPASKKKTIEAS